MTAEHVNGRQPFMPVPGKIPGAVVNLSGNELILAPLNLAGIKAARELEKEKATIEAGDEEMMITFAAKMLLLSLRRNYEEMTLEEVIGLLDLRNVREALDTLTRLSGLEPTRPGEMRPGA